MVMNDTVYLIRIRQTQLPYLDKYASVDYRTNQL